MIFNAENILLIGSILLFVSIVVSKTGYRFGIPTLLVFFDWSACCSEATAWDSNSMMRARHSSSA